MAREQYNLRLEADLLEWARGYAQERGVTVTALFAQALQSFREDAKGGVPEIREPASAKPSRCKGAVHRWDSRGEDGRAVPGVSKCLDCGQVKPTRSVAGSPQREAGDSDFDRLTMARAELFAKLRTPDSISGKTTAKKAYEG